MNPSCILADHVTPQAWRNGGGLTRELLLWPPQASAAEWQVRITLAEVAQDGPFSSFAGVQRHFVVVQGCGLSLRWPDGPWQDLAPGHPPLSFDGGQPPDCRLLRPVQAGVPGCSTDLNLTTRGLQGQMVAMQRGVAMNFATPWRGFFAACAGRWWRGDGDAADAAEVPAQALVWQGDGSVTGMAPETWHFEPSDMGAPDQPLGWWLAVAPHK